MVCALNPGDFLLPSPQFPLCLPGLPANFSFAFEVYVQPVWNDPAVSCNKQAIAVPVLACRWDFQISDEYFEEHNFIRKLDALGQ